MNFVALVTLDGTPQAAGTLAAFVGDAVRGVVGPSPAVPFGPHAGKRTFDLVAYASEVGEALSFRFAGCDGSVAELAATVAFAINGQQGDAMDPFVLSGPTPAALPSAVPRPS